MTKEELFKDLSYEECLEILEIAYFALKDEKLNDIYAISILDLMDISFEEESILRYKVNKILRNESFPSRNLK